MFTGLVEDLGQLEARQETDDGAVLRVTTRLGAELAEGDSIAVNGTCLTATEVSSSGFAAEVMNQTLALTALGRARSGDPLNLELAMKAGARLGGHMVQGHVDGVGRVASVEADGFARRLRIEIPPELARYVVEHGSITLNGVSLTVSAVSEASPAAGAPWLEVSLIPETLERTNLGGAEVGTVLNVECDVIAKYVERLSEAHRRV